MSKGVGRAPSMDEQARNPKEKKRKRSEEGPEDEIEIDVNLPEPPSKKAKRKEKKTEKRKTTQADPEVSVVNGGGVPAEKSTSGEELKDSAAPVKQRSDYGIWIGNLNFSTTKEDLRKFLSEEGGIADDDITRIHLPPPKDGGAKKLEKNRGFAYIDLATPEILEKSLLLSEKFLFGRNVLIKNAKSFEGRPSKPNEAQAGSTKTNDAKEPTKRIFVGNLGFDVTREEIAEHFGQAGEVEDVFLASFEDSGKCKGFGWVRFAEVEAAAAAVKGFIFKVAEPNDGGDDESEREEAATDEAASKAKKQKLRKWFINRLQGRELRREFAEDANTRYKKRFGKDAKLSKSNNITDSIATHAPTAAENERSSRQDDSSRPASSKPDRKSGNSDDRREERRKRHEKMDARKIAPGQAHSGAQRSSAAIVAGAGNKISFD